MYRNDDEGIIGNQLMKFFLLGQKDVECFQKVFPTARIAHKTGELSGLYDDAGIIFRQEGDLILCIMDNCRPNREQNIVII